MKDFYLSIVVVLILISCKKENIKNDLKKENIKGEVKLITSIEKDLRYDIELKTISEFNIEGNLISEKRYTNNSLTDSKQYQYKKGKLSIVTSFFLDNQGVISKSVSYYNDLGHESLTRHFNNENELVYEWKKTYDFDTNQNIKLLTLHKTFGLVKGKKTENTGLSSFIGSKIYKYKNEFLVSIEDRDDFGLLDKMLVIDKKGKTVEEVHYSKETNNPIHLSVKYKYVNGNIFTETGWISDGSEWVKRYKIIEFDAQKNWINRIIYYNDKIRFEESRKLEYYNF